MVRTAYVAGYFYERVKEKLIKQIEACFLSSLGPGKLPEEKTGEKENKIVAGISPHAGYVYSGACAAHFYHAISLQKKRKRIIIFGINHNNIGLPIATTKQDWETPFGIAKVDEELAELLEIPADEEAHRYEHSIEVQLPFLQYIYGDDFTFLPISLSSYAVSEKGIGIEDNLKNLSNKIKEELLIIASSDFTHYEPAEIAEKKDKEAIKFILNLDAAGFLNKVYSENLSICGYAPVAACINSAKILGAKKAELLKYMNSGDVTKDYSSVVAYASFAFSL